MDDAAFKKLFSDPRMIRLVIRRHVPAWARRVDYRTLRPLPTELIDGQLRRRYPDVTWRVRTTDGSTDLILLLEFQGRPERHMAMRTTVYGCLAAQSLIRHDKTLGQGNRELALVALVLHHGERRWSAPTRLSDLFRDSAPDAYRFVAQSVTAMLRSKGFSNRQLEEAMTMGAVVTEFQRSLDEIRQEGHQEGRREGRQEGRREGIEQGRAAVLVQLIARKFGPRTAEEVRRLIVGSSGPDRIALIAAAILDCDTREEFLARVRED